MLTATGMAIGADDPAASANATAAHSNNNTFSDCQTLFKGMAGEWEGTIQTRNGEGMGSASVTSATCRIEDGGKRLALYYEGFAFGQSVNGGMMFSAGNQPGAAINRDGSTMKARGTMDGASMAFSYPSSNSKAASYQHTVTLLSPNHMVTEIYAINSKGERSMAFRLDLNRLDSGQKAAASATFASAKSLASARSAVNSVTQQAGVDTGN